MDEIEIKWPSGKVETLHDVPADFIYTIIEGTGIQQKTKLPALLNVGAGVPARAGPDDRNPR